MVLIRQISRVAKLLVDEKGIGFDEAEARLRAMTLEIHVGADAASPAGHAAALTALAVGRRSFLGGVSVTGALDQPLRSRLSSRTTLGEALSDIGVTTLSAPPAARVTIGGRAKPGAIAAWWDGWRAGVRADGKATCGDALNPLAGIAAGALVAGAAFQSLRGLDPAFADVDLWPGSVARPAFGEVFLPAALWLIGLGNLGQAYLWSLGALPYADPATLLLVLQDYDRVSKENWVTSVLVADDCYGALKTKMAEAWADARGFTIRRVDRAWCGDIRLTDGDPRLALSGLDKVVPRRLLASAGFDAIIDAGLGRTARDFDRYRVSIFDAVHDIDRHFADIADPVPSPDAPETPAYQRLERELGRCGAAAIGNASVAVPYVSAVAGVTAIARAIALASGQPCSPSEAQRVATGTRRAVASPRFVQARGIGHAGRPEPL